MRSGVLGFPLRPYRGPFLVDGVALTSPQLPAVRWAMSEDSGPGVLTLADGSSFVQSRLLGEDQPATVDPLQVDFQVVLAEQAQLEALRGARARSRAGVPSRWYFGLPVQDVWLLGEVAPGRTQWRSSRRHAYGLAQVPAGMHPPRAWVRAADGLESALTVSWDGGAVADEVGMPSATGAANFTVNFMGTTASLSGAELHLVYLAEVLALVTAYRESLVVENALTVAFTLDEVLTGPWAVSSTGLEG